MPSPLLPARTALIATLGEQFESKRAGDRGGLNQAHRYPVAELVGLAASLADQRVVILLVAEVFLSNCARGDEAVGASVIELDEQSGTGDARDVTLEGCADLIGEE